jgi:hypothetical protein
MRRVARKCRDLAPLPLEGLLVGFVSLACAAWALQLWRANLAIPLRYTPVDDTKFYLMLVKGIVDHGWYLSNSSLGAPFGQQLKDFPQGGDDLSLLIVRGLALLFSNPAVVVNLFFLLTFPLAAFTAHLVLRSLGVGAPAAGVAAVLFSLLTYHFFRGESHLLLSAYYAVPLSLYLFLRTLADAPLFTALRESPSRLPPWLSRRALATLALCVVIGSDNLYYATFTVTMLLGALIVLLALRRWRAAFKGLVLVALVAATVVANLSPSLLYQAEHGSNPAVERSAAFTEKVDEAFSLRLANLILPPPGNRVAPLSRIATKYDHTIAPGYCEACYASLGTVGTVGFLWLILVALGSLLGVVALSVRRRLLAHASLGVLIALAIATIGGVASLIEVFITPDIRAWNRISVFIAFLSLLAFALLAERVLERLKDRLRMRPRLGSALTSIVFVAILAFGTFDQTSASLTPSYAATAQQWHSDGRFVAEIEQRLPRGASVFQLPFVPFPEGYPETPVGDQVATYATKYEQLRGYLHSSQLRWSYGAIKGRPEDWAAQLAGQPLSYVVAAAAASGFDGLWVDPAGFEPSKAHEIRTTLEALLAQGALVSPRGDLWFFDLRPYLTRLRHSSAGALLGPMREQTLHPVRSECVPGGLALVNPAHTARQVTLSVHLTRVGAGSNPATSLPPDGQASDVPASESVEESRRLTLAPGRSVVKLAGAGTGSAPHVLYATVTDDALRGFARSAIATASSLVPGLTGPPCGH